MKRPRQVTGWPTPRNPPRPREGCWSSILKRPPGVTSLEVQWLRFHLPMQGVQVWSLVRELWSHTPWGQKNKTWNRSNVVTKSTEDFKKMVHIKKNLKKKKKRVTGIHRKALCRTFTPKLTVTSPRVLSAVQWQNGNRGSQNNKSRMTSPNSQNREYVTLPNKGILHM